MVSTPSQLNITCNRTMIPVCEGIIVRIVVSTKCPEFNGACLPYLQTGKIHKFNLPVESYYKTYHEIVPTSYNLRRSWVKKNVKRA